MEEKTKAQQDANNVVYAATILAQETNKITQMQGVIAKDLANQSRGLRVDPITVFLVILFLAFAYMTAVVPA